MTIPPGFRVRRATLADVDSLVALRLALFEELGEGPEAASSARFENACRTAIASALRDSLCLAWIAQGPDDEVAASLIMLLFPRLPSPRITGTCEGYILNVYTKPAWRGKGGASALLAAAEAEARQRGLARIRLHTSPRGRPVYQLAGYQPRTDEMELVLTSSPSE